MRRGISLIALLITMVIMITLVSTITISGITTLNNNKKVTFATEINMMQSAVDTYKTKMNGDWPVEAKVELDISNVTEKSRFQFDGEVISDSKVTLYKINYSPLGITSLRYGSSSDENDMYVVSKDTGRVYYTKGLQVGSITYYTLTDDLKNIISSNPDGANVSQGIVFNVSETAWTLNKVIATISVPKEYTNVTVSVNGKIGTYDPNTSGSTNIYTIDNVEGNYTIIVTYTKDGKENKAEYTIDNVDSEAPIFTADNVKENVLESAENTSIYLSLSGYKDTLSGIKTIKYAYLSMTDATEIANYFKTGGLKVYNDVIEIEEISKDITIYIEDNVGNFTALPYTLSDETYAKVLERDYVKDTNPTQVKDGITYTAYIPDGFYYVGGEVTTGLVISDNIQDRNKGVLYDNIGELKGNQFVWVPVNYILQKQTLKPGVSNFISLKTAFSYNASTSTISGVASSFSEPYVNAAAWENIEYAEMVQSITKYGGFYIARYEAGKDSNGKLVSKKGVNIWNNIPWGQSMTAEGTNSAVYMAHNMYKEDVVVSHLIYDTQWDCVMYWANIEGKNVSNSSAWGNYTASLNVSGNSSAYQTNNIFDLAGNVWEWTMGASVTTNRALRGGSFGDTNGFAGNADLSRSITFTSANVGFRVALYLK